MTLRSSITQIKKRDMNAMDLFKRYGDECGNADLKLRRPRRGPHSNIIWRWQKS
ncbi:hypothetical protein SAMN05216228_106915 [Rhizobium tibeticum]|uniref:Uncharacterized protein n=1 Tax=Rhizobium tibeticum TaxID=501024 RepID=A0A1H8WLK4_9HYPH|nr:hypothetical protein RTCCBAU85039_6578 [Rhizobium tibeticum]SEP28516.1 hypothetical protein SAMN05216228_106915 [Rhizobium tibeticum]